MKNWKSAIVKSCMLLTAVFLIGAAVPASAKTAPKLSSKKITLKVGQKKKLKVKNVKKKKVKWSSKKKAVATVNKKGVVKAKKKGKTTIIAKVGKKKLKCKVVVKKTSSKKKDSKKKNNGKISKKIKKQLPYGNDTLVFRYVDRIGLGKQMDLFPYVWCAGEAIQTPSNTIKANYYKWYSSDSSVISIDKYGVATAHKIGKVKMYYKYRNRTGEWKTSNTITVEVIDVGNVSLSYTFGHNATWAANAKKKIARVTQIDDTAVNYVTVTVTNNSDKAIVMKKDLSLYCYMWIEFQAVDNQDVTVLSGETKTITYKNEIYLLAPTEIEKISYMYILNGKTTFQDYFIKENRWEYSANK